MELPTLRLVTAGLVTGIMILGTSSPAWSQCSAMTGGAHEHPASRAGDSDHASTADRKLRQAIDRLLSDERGRALLAQVLLEDRGFIVDFIPRLTADPRWRTEALRHLAPFDSSAARSQDATAPAAREAARYTCPMHADVTAAAPGDCPRCGMALVRRSSSQQ